MIRSMTAYARREIKGDWGSAAWELRSVNQRYLETYFRLPEQFRSLEPVVRERIRARLTRGKVECTLRFEQDPSAQGELILNEKLAKQLVNAANWVKMQSDEGKSTRLISALAWRDGRPSRISTPSPPTFWPLLTARWTTLSSPAKPKARAKALI
jgi:uncharacterized protein (TIGR00255 family)